MGGAGDKPKKGERLRKLFDFLFGFENRRGEVLGGWLCSADGFSCPPQDFYAAIERQIEARKFPHVTASRQEFAEGGPLSDQRQYLRFMRERFAVVACAAPFGNVYFFSCRTVHVPALVRLWHIIAATLFFCLISNLLVRPLGPTFAVIAVIGLVFAMVGVMRNAGALADLDALLLRIPIIATIYEDWFRTETYYREDTRALYAKFLPELIQKAAEEVCAEKGVKLVRQDKYPPILEELFRTIQGNKPENSENTDA